MPPSPVLLSVVCHCVVLHVMFPCVSLHSTSFIGDELAGTQSSPHAVHGLCTYCTQSCVCAPLYDYCLCVGFQCRKSTCLSDHVRAVQNGCLCTLKCDKLRVFPTSKTLLQLYVDQKCTAVRRIWKAVEVSVHCSKPRPRDVPTGGLVYLFAS